MTLRCACIQYPIDLWQPIVVLKWPGDLQWFSLIWNIGITTITSGIYSKERRWAWQLVIVFCCLRNLARSWGCFAALCFNGWHFETLLVFSRNFGWMLTIFFVTSDPVERPTSLLWIGDILAYIYPLFTSPYSFCACCSRPEEAVLLDFCCVAVWKGYPGHSALTDAL